MGIEPGSPWLLVRCANHCTITTTLLATEQSVKLLVSHRVPRQSNIQAQDSASDYPRMIPRLSAKNKCIIYITNCRQYVFGLLRLISTELMYIMKVKLINPPQMSHTCGTSKPCLCQSAQTSELVSMRNTTCPLQGKCLSRDIVYQATVKTQRKGRKVRRTHSN